MHQFLNLNRHKLPFAFKATSPIFLVFILAVFIIAYINGQQADIDAIIIGLLLFGIALPCFIIVVSYWVWYYKQWAKRKAFSKSPFDQLHELGFSDSLINEKSKWSYTEKVKAGNINSFKIIADILYDKSHIIEFRAFAAWRQVDKNEYKRLNKEFRTYDIEFDIASFVKSYNTKKLSVLSIGDLKIDLEEFTELLKRNGFVPNLNMTGHNMDL